MGQESLAHIALHERAQDVLDDAAATARRVIGVPSAFAAVAQPGGGYPMAVRHGLAEPGWARVDVRPGRGLGGRVLQERQPVVARDYLEDSTITADYRDVVGAEGLRGIGCVPVAGADGDLAALLYVGDRHVGAPGSRVVDELRRIADMATVGLCVVARTTELRRPLDAIAAIARRARLAAEPRAVDALLGEIADVAAGADEGTAPACPVRLTGRERDVLELLAAGASNRQIAERLVLAESTVKGYVRALLEKLDAGSRLELVAQARRWGLA